MVTRIALGGSSISKRMVAFVIAALAAVLLVGIAGYLVNTSHQAAATSTVSQSNSSLSDMPTRTLRGGPQKFDTAPSKGFTAGGPARGRVGGVQP
jgi:hypothetical protein